MGVKKEQELIGPQIRKRGSLVNAFEQTSEHEMKRQSITKDEVRVDSHRFNDFISKFENKDQRAEAKAQMIKITKQQKEFEKQKQLKEQEKQLKEQQEEEQRQKEEEDLEIQKAIEEEIRIQNLREIEEEEIRIRQLEEEERKKQELIQEEKGVPEKRKVIKKKKKAKKEEETLNVDDAPKLALGVVSYNDVKSKFEKKKMENQADITSPTKPLRINKLNNPFMENIKPEEKIISKEVKVNKLKKNSFMQQLEKAGPAVETCQQLKEKKATKKEEPKLKKISSEANIKFESKKEKKPEQEVKHLEENKSERKMEIRVSKSIEGHNPKKKISKENKSGSTMSLHKIFIDGPKEFFRSSKEKLYKLSKETLCEFNEPVEELNQLDQKPTRNEMQNYLLSHVLFDGKDVVKKEKINKKDEDDIENYLDKEYKAKIDQYCSLLEDEKPQKKRKKKKTKEKKIEEKLPSIKMVEIKSIQQQLQQQNIKPPEKTPAKVDDTMFNRNESKVNKFREMFDIDNNNQNEVKEIGRGQENRRSKKVKSDIFYKIKALENSEKERLQREKENEERIKMLLQMEMERQKHNEGERMENKSEDEAEENLKQNILQCLEDEVQNLEQEMIALENEEQLILEEEAEEIEEAAKKYETNIDNDDTELAEHITQLQEIHVEIEERKKVAKKKKNVLERFQHVFDKDESEQKSGIKVGSIHDRLANF